MRVWKNRIALSESQSLTENGRLYMRELGDRMRDRLFDLVAEARNEQVTVLSTDEERTKQSADEYLAGMLNFMPQSDRPAAQFNGQENIYLLSSSDACEKYVNVYMKCFY
jgi:hypothetical protein